MLYTLNLQNAVCQLHLNKTGKEKDYKFFSKTNDIFFYIKMHGKLITTAEMI